MTAISLRDVGIILCLAFLAIDTGLFVDVLSRYRAWNRENR